jgi:hypothetical protein
VLERVELIDEVGQVERVEDQRVGDVEVQALSLEVKLDLAGECVAVAAGVELGGTRSPRGRARARSGWR